MSNYDQLILKIDQFTRKFYLNKVIKGALFSIGLILFLFILFNVLEYYFFLPTTVRKVFYFSFLGASIGALGFWVINPLFKYFRLNRVISHEQAAGIIGGHFGDVKDKLLNILQLKDQASHSDNGLIMASINQKTEEIKLVPFKTAIDLSKNKKFLRYAVPPLLLLLLILWGAPSIIKDGTNRIINNNTEYEREAPFSFNLKTEELEVVQFENLEVEVEMEGEVMPEAVFVMTDDYKFRLKQKDNSSTFVYTFSNIQEDFDFKLTAGGFNSKGYEVTVIKKPAITGFETTLDYPNYTGQRTDKYENVGDLTMPVGTSVDWSFDTKNATGVKMQFGGNELQPLKRKDENNFGLKKRILTEGIYRVFISNDKLPNADSILYTLSVTPDLYPKIGVKEFKDTIDGSIIYFVGEASDDYGLSRLSFNYSVEQYKGTTKSNSVSLPLNKNSAQGYEHTWMLDSLGLKPGDKLTYYFEVFDNDGVHGAKSSKTQMMNFELKTIEELKEQEKDNNESIKDKLEKSVEEAKKIQKDVKKMKEKLLQKEEMNWQDKQELQKLLEQQQALKEQLEEAKKEFDENIENQEKMDEMSEELMEKQEMLQEMFEELLDEDMKKTIEEIQEMLEDMEKEEMIEKMEESEMDNEELEKELERMEEMFKQMEVEKELEEQIEKLEELAKQEEELSEKTKEEDANKEEIQKEQEEIKEELEKLKEENKELQEKNKELEDPVNMPDHEEEMDEAEEEMEQSQEEMEKNENEKASESQKKASEKMKKMAKAMKMEMEAGEQEQAEEDMAALRQLLENIIGLSFNQEDVMDNISTENTTTARFVDLTQEQFKIKDDFKMVKDSLHELSKRIYQIESFVTEKVAEVSGHLKKGIDDLEERQVQRASVHQQFTMTGLNDLALMLDEVMQQMQQSMSGDMPGSQNCSKPGGTGKGNKGKPKDKAGSSQMELNKMLEKMKEAAKGGGSPGSSKEFAQLAAKQAAIRKALENAQRKNQEEGKGKDGEIQQLIDEMNKTEIDLVNKKLSAQMMKRQKDILTRLLKSEEATRQREYDNKRKGKTAQQIERPLPPSLKDYIKKREAEIEVYQSISPELRPFYRYLVEEYYRKLKEE